MTGDGRGTKMRPFRETIPIDEALRIVGEAARPLDRTVRVGLAAANRRVLAARIVADRDVPPFDRAAMDGYAVVAADTSGAGPQAPAELRCVGTVHTGEVATRALVRGECIQIATGAPLPDGADAVVMVEQTDRRGDAVEISTSVHARQHVGRRGADIEAGQTVLQPGDVLTPSRVGSIAALGIAEVDVYDRPRVGIVSTGDEIVAPGQIYDINRFTLGAVIGEHGGTAAAHPITGDSIDALGAAVDAIIAQGTDVLVFSGGSSVGERDLTRDVLREKGNVAFHGIAVKPGKPTAFGHIGSTPVLGMPGYPTSCLSNAYLLLVPLLRRMAHLPPHRTRTVTVPAAHRFASVGGRHQFYSVRVVDGSAVGAFKASGDITSMSQADGYIEIPMGVDAVEKGEPVDVTLF
ncbi:MAG: molybdopterin molybdotransferase MoeA [Acidobacteria bacterium]|nr:molybdopterin molybdotransferase MoeA [Acidobacteriota bacterium]